MAGVSSEVVQACANSFVGFINRSPSPYHVVNESRKLLLESSFKELKETESWNVKPNDMCFMTRNQSTLIAFAVGGKYKPGNGFTMVGAHTDSPCLKVKPISKRNSAGYIQVGVETYGGGTWHTWLDRDLKLAGRVMVKTDSGLEHHLVDINRPILRIPNLAIHLNREMGTEFKWNKEKHLAPVMATLAAEELSKGSSGETDEGKHHPILMKLISDELKVPSSKIMDFDICLADFTPGVIGGALNEFIFAPRQDNLISTYCALEAFKLAEGLADDTNIRLITLFDNEEVGSQSAQGAGSSLTEFTLRRLAAGGSSVAFEEAIPKSLMLSCDVSHAINPNYCEKHEDQHKPAFHKGMVIKFNALQRYSTTAITTSMFRVIAEKGQVPLQEFVIRQDMACGSTIGPIISAKLGVPTIDIGSPLLSMHSIREMCDVTSVEESIRLFKSYFKNYPGVFESVKL